LLEELDVRDLALVERSGAAFREGLNLLTGETGSGKSLIVDALGLSLGARASADQVRHGAARALVETTFGLADAPGAAALLRELGHDEQSRLVMTREVGGRGGARLNGRPASPGQLRELGRHLVGIHGQHEHQQLLDVEAQTLLVDAYAGALEQRERVAAAHAALTQTQSHLTSLERMQARGQREEEYLRFQLEELRGAALRTGEDEELAAERAAVRHIARLGELTETALSALRAEGGLPLAAEEVRLAGELDPRLRDLGDRLAALDEEAADLAGQLRRYREGLEADPARLEEIEARLALLEGIKRKYGASLQAAIEERDRLEAQLSQAEDLEEALQGAASAVSVSRSEFEIACAELSAMRGPAARRFGDDVAGELAVLRLEGARFAVELRPRPEPDAEGAESAEMMFSANPGEPMAALARVASGGELSRVMLAVKTVGADLERLPTLVFDEVDSGIGGEAAVQVGLRLKGLGSRRQVLVVTHLAQIACFADHHLVVEKRPGADGRNLIAVRELGSADERAAELARMMSGGVTAKALARAHELMDEARLVGTVH
jgi:DNA repair protein RecN (Recombination protein N)